MGMDASEHNFLQALAATKQAPQTKIVLILPRNQLNTLAQQGMLGEISERTQARFDLGPDNPMDSHRQVQLSGTPLANALSVMHLQEKMLQVG